MADARHQIHWGKYRTFLHQVEKFTSRLTSSQRYVFRRDRVVGFVKKGLINVERVDNIQGRVDSIMRRYRRSREPTPLWRA